MKNTNKYKGKQVLVIGLAKSGYSAAMLLHQLGATITVNDIKRCEENQQVEELRQKGIDVVCGSHPLTLLENVELIVKNPGIRYDNPLIMEAEKRGIPIITEVELAWHVSEAEFIGITGSNGKTTTTMLVTKLLQADDKHPIEAGNIGTVVSEVATRATSQNIIVTELSSFQLMGTLDFRPKVSVLLNIFDAHLDYHGTKEEYIKAKAKLLANQSQSDFVVYNYDDEIVRSIVKQSHAIPIPFSRKQPLDRGAYIHDDVIYFNREQVVSTEIIALPGSHNLENVLAAIATAKLYGTHNESIERVLATFQGAKHRLEYITTMNKRRFFNDSKATNILATEKAIRSFQEPVILIAGGLDRGNGFDELIPALQKHVKSVISFGETARKLQKTAQRAGVKQAEIVNTMEEAVVSAYELSAAGDVILLSPACASWDQYKTFEERGDMFVNSVHKLKV